MLQRRWRGQEIRGKVPGPCYVVVRGNSAEFRGADTNEWYKATFTLKGDSDPKRIVCLTTGSSYASMVGATRSGIYRIDSGAIMLAINEANDPTVPVCFDAPGARQFVFQKQ